VPVGDVEIVSQNFARQMGEANAQPSCRKVGPDIKPVSLISLGLCGMADGSLVEIATASGGRRLADVKLGSGAGGVNSQREVDFVAGSDVSREEVRDENTAAIAKAAGDLVGFRSDFYDAATADCFRDHSRSLDTGFHNCLGRIQSQTDQIVSALRYPKTSASTFVVSAESLTSTSDIVPFRLGPKAPNLRRTTIQIRICQLDLPSRMRGDEI